VEKGEVNEIKRQIAFVMKTPGRVMIMDISSLSIARIIEAIPNCSGCKINGHKKVGYSQEIKSESLRRNQDYPKYVGMIPEWRTHSSGNF
jgi:hypothetical protein